MAGGKPIIINLKGEASELIEKACCGICVAEENPKALAQAIIELKNNSEKTKQLGENGRNFVENNYTREKISEELEKLIHKLS